MSGNTTQYDVVIIGSGVSGNTIAWQLGLAGKKVLILEAGVAVPDSREKYMENFYLALAKTPEAPYPTIAGRRSPDGQIAQANPAFLPTPRATVLGLGGSPDTSYLVQAQANGKTNPPTDDDDIVRGLQFSSTFDRTGGGTSMHWLGTSLRELENDLQMNSQYGVFTDWPVSYTEMQGLWAKAEAAIGVAASTAQQQPLEVVGLAYPPGYQYPMGPIPMSIVDNTISSRIAGLKVPGMLPKVPGAREGSPGIPDGDDAGPLYDVFVTPTPAGRNSEPYQDRRVCAGNTNCIPICPIQAKWDPTVTLGQALDTGNVTVCYQSVAVNIAVDGDNVTQIDYLTWSCDPSGELTSEANTVTAKRYVLAAHAIENAKLLLMSNNGAGICNSSDQVGRNLMDHPLYLSWALIKESDAPIWGYRGPLATAGIESLRDGEFRKYRSSFRMEIGNEGWNFPAGDPYNTAMDYVQGTNNTQLNPDMQRLGGLALAQKLNSLLTRQFRIAVMFDQAPLPDNRVTLDPLYTDGLGLPRPHIDYGLDPYTMEGFRVAADVCSKIYQTMNAVEYTKTGKGGTGDFTYKGVDYHYSGAGHLMGTHRMGTCPATSVVNANQRAHDVPNLWIVGSGSFPTAATANPTLTLMALAFKSADDILSTLGA